jgi:hypothetical protein
LSISSLGQQIQQVGTLVARVVTGPAHRPLRIEVRRSVNNSTAIDELLGDVEVAFLDGETEHSV